MTNGSSNNLRSKHHNKSEANKVSTRAKLSADFIEAVQEQWRLRGKTALGEMDDTKFCEMVSRTVQQEAPTNPFNNAQSPLEVGRALFRAMGKPDEEITDVLAMQASDLNNEMMSRLEAMWDAANGELQ